MPRDSVKAAAYLARYRAEHTDEIRRGQKDWYLRNRDWCRENMRETNYRLRYGITVADYDDMFKIQGGKCAICKSPSARGKGRFHVDHDHATGKIRGLLCHTCNTSLAHPERFGVTWENYLKYLIA
jgi:hypothetical protein